MSHVLQIQKIAEAQRRQAYQPEAGVNSIAIIVEDYQRYLEYLDELKIARLDKINTTITASVDGQKIRFENVNDFANWLAEHMT